jgi:hypothetical protein
MSVLPRAGINFAALLNAGKKRTTGTAVATAPPQPAYRELLWEKDLSWFLLIGGMLSAVLQLTGFGFVTALAWPIAVGVFVNRYGKLYESVP